MFRHRSFLHASRPFQKWKLQVDATQTATDSDSDPVHCGSLGMVYEMPLASARLM